MQNKHKIKSRTKVIVERGPQNIRREQNEWEMQSRKRKMENNPEELHNMEKVRKKLSRKKQISQNPEKVKEDQLRWQQKARPVDTENKRLLRFRKKTMFNAIFTCICCQRNLFECNVVKFTTKLLVQMETKNPGL